MGIKSNDNNPFLKTGENKVLSNSSSTESVNLEITIPDALKASMKKTHSHIKKFYNNIKEAGNNVDKIDSAIREYRRDFEIFKRSKKKLIEITPVNILKHLSRNERNLRELNELFNVAETDNDGQTKKLKELILDLRNQDLIETEMRDSDSPIKITTKLKKILSTLGVKSIEELALLNDGGIATKPIWGSPKRVVDPPEIYVLMPFEMNFDKVYESLIKNVAEKLPSDRLDPFAPPGRSIERADDSFVPGAVMSKVWNGIYHARLIIADCTGKNTNVFYEMAIAHAIGKPTMIITQNESHIPFDIKHLGYIHYSTDSKKDLELLAEKLIKGILKLEIFDYD